MSGLLLGVDGGNSKTDLVLLDDTGRVLASVHGPSSARFLFGLDDAMDRLGAMVDQVRREAGVGASDKISVGVFALAGADLPHEEVELALAIAQRGWVEREVVRNDVFAILRAGTEREWGVAVVCGAGINCIGVGPDGRVARFPALGTISGDWGGGGDVGMGALGAAVRAQDGRGPETVLSQLVPAHFGLPDAYAVMTAIHVEEMDVRRVLELAPVLLDAAEDGDPVSQGFVSRLADELAGCAIAALHRLDLVDSDPDVVLGGGMLAARRPLLNDAVERRILAVCPRASVHPVEGPPVVGSALLALAEVGADPAAGQRVREALR